MISKDFEKWALPIVRKYQKILLLEDHLLTFEQSNTVEGGITMHHLFMYPYKETCIQYGSDALAMWKRKDKKTLKEVIIHELCHSVTDPLYGKATNRFIGRDELNDERERLTDHIANIIVKLEV